MAGKKLLTDIDVKKKAVKLVIAHLKKKITSEFAGKEHALEWIDEIEELLEQEEFVVSEFYAKRRELNDVIERTLDEEMRYKLRDSWLSLGKALDKKLKR
jgi:hypothetical protein